ncbi:flavin reductase family protein [Actinomycetospora chiangmaiensis]|uniref:flavin reductase family protein n=1 Tax=Actinomycetospora chiangmaiensis TaxID=402650 RepID=UPI000A063582|nr:flavin reductase family protein [Actinomycetospora chiangmaiensis]
MAARDPGTDGAPPGGLCAVPLDASGLRLVLGAHPQGVIALAAVVDGALEGIAVSTFTPVSLEPALVSVCVAHTSTTWPRLRTAPGLGVSVLAEDHAQLARRLAAPGQDRFVGTSVTVGASGAVLIDGACAWFDCVVENEITAGDHLIAVLAVLEAHHRPDVRPLVFHRSSFARLA